MFRLTLPILIYKKYIPNKVKLEKIQLEKIRFKRNELEKIKYQKFKEKLQHLHHLDNLEQFKQVEYNLKLSQQLLIFIENQMIGIKLNLSSTPDEINKFFLNNKLIEFTNYKNKIQIYNLSTEDLLEIKKKVQKEV